MTDAINCSVPDCPNHAARGGRCWTHLKRKKRGIPLERQVRGYGMSKEEKRRKAALRYANAETEQELERAAALLKKY